MKTQSLLLVIALLTACSPPTGGPSSGGLSIVYDSNGAESGTVPVDATHYQKGQSLVIPGTRGDSSGLSKAGAVWTVWNTILDGTGTDFFAGDTLTFQDSNVRLFAKWLAVPTVIAIGNRGASTGYWRNQTWVDLPLGGNPSPISTNYVLVHGTDVYVSGGQGTGVATGYWKNGTWVDLPGSASAWVSARGLLLDGNDLTVVGVQGNQPGYWLNGTWTDLPLDPAENSGVTRKAVVSGTDVLVCGTQAATNGASVPGYWTSGVWQSLPLVQAMTSGMTNAVVTAGADVYVSGNQNNGNTNVAGYWKNGAWVGLPTLASVDRASSEDLFVDGNDVYVAGCQGALPGYWKNGAWQPLPTLGYGFGAANSIVVANGLVFVAGALTPDTGDFVPGYWVNGTWVTLPGLGATSTANTLALQ